MKKEHFASIAAVNYWDTVPQRLGFSRRHYVDQLINYQNNQLLKVLVGQRRCGKSTLLKQVIANLVAGGTPKQNILYLNFELHQLQFIQSADTLTEIVQLYYQQLQPADVTYLFFDEIQEVQAWEKVINSYLANERYQVEIFITGSNAHLLSSELSTFVTGRYIELPIYPFSFDEYLHYYNLELNRKNLITYLEDSGIPELFALKEERQKIAYLKALKDSILMNDIIKRFDVKDPKLLILILDFLIDNIGRLFSLAAIVKKLQSIGIKSNSITVGNYVRYLEMTFLVDGISRYDVKGKKILEGERKYYLNDLAFANYLQSTFDDGITRKLENFVYQTLVRAGYQVYVGNIYQLEVDFVAEKNKQVIYIQVTYLLHSQAVIEREYGNLQRIKDSWPKWVVSLDDVSFPPKEGILHVPAWKIAEML